MNVVVQLDTASWLIKAKILLTESFRWQGGAGDQKNEQERSNGKVSLLKWKQTDATLLLDMLFAVQD